MIQNNVHKYKIKEHKIMFYRIVLTAITTLLIILCFEIGHIERVIAENSSNVQKNVQKIVICNVTGELCVEPKKCEQEYNYRFEKFKTYCSLPVFKPPTKDRGFNKMSN